jgi:rsbT co-antagonist protein RsbR
MLYKTSATQLRPLLVTDQDVELRKAAVGLEQEDIERIVSLKNIIEPRVDHYTEAFFKRLAKIGGASPLFMRHDALEEAKRRKREHLLALSRGKYDRDYVEQRIDLAVLYSLYGIESRPFIGAFQQLVQSIGNDIFEQLRADPGQAFLSYMALTKVGYFDVSIISDVLVAERERTIRRQQEAIRELSTPVLQIRDRLLILPVIGVLDSQRAKQLTDDLLQAIRVNRAKMVVMDITGVAAVDSRVANHLIQTVAAARLMGSTVIITGLSAEVAQALVALGIDLGKIATTSDLQAGMEQAERSLGYRTVQFDEARALAEA